MGIGLELKFFNSKTRKKEAFQPLEAKRVLLYTCGPTVYNFAHIGNFRTYVFEDLLRRTLIYFGYRVKQVMNLTDIDDKTLIGAREQNTTLEKFTKPFKDAFFEDLKALSIQPAEYYPSAIEYIPQMIQVVEDLLQKGIAYKGGDGSVYFSIRKFPHYGALSHFHIDELKQGASERVHSDEYGKENISDFVLWKAWDPERDGPIHWESSLGKGRPGWHLECSTMAISLLGPSLDIHVGGIDNMFPHHENEIAQSECHTGKTFANYWMHSEHLVVDGKKMSKSLGNVYTLRNLLEKGFRGREVRYLLLQTHYKTQLNFTLKGLEAARHSLERLKSFIERLRDVTATANSNVFDALLQASRLRFEEALADDLNISEALASLFDLVRDVNKLIDESNFSKKNAEDMLTYLKKIDTVLGLLPLEDTQEIPETILQAVQERDQARLDKNWKKSDELRAFIMGEGFLVEDTPNGTKVKRP